MHLILFGNAYEQGELSQLLYQDIIIIDITI